MPEALECATGEAAAPPRPHKGIPDRSFSRASSSAGLLPGREDLLL